MQSENNNEYRYVPALIRNQGNMNNVRINLAKDLDEVGLLLLIALFTSANYPMTVSEEEIHKEITSLLEAGDWDGLAYKGLKWIREITGE
jgi:hypothetical protein